MSQQERPLILVHAAHPQALEYAGPAFGRLLSPREYSRARDTAAAGIPWAADNDCYQGLVPERYRAMLRAIAHLPGCLFVTAPDVVGNWQATRDLFELWAPELQGLGLPVALVAQDGLTAARTPWQSIDALFIGGSTEWKLSTDAQRVAAAARERGLWLHMGRVNSRRRYDYARAIGCDSVDGSSFSKWRSRWLPRALTWHRDPYQTIMEAP
jgi:hypothetical protein